MRTRTLLLLAVGCGLLILTAGVVQLSRIAGEEDAPHAARVGEPVHIGDLTVTVEDFREGDGSAVVTVVLGGVDDPDAAEDFRLVVPGAALVPVPGQVGGAASCAGTTVTAQRCTLWFDVADVEGTSRVLLYRRGDEQVRWELGTG